jgi:hypothetical protein
LHRLCSTTERRMIVKQNSIFAKARFFNGL